MLRSLWYLVFRCALQTALRCRSNDFKELEIIVLRHELVHIDQFRQTGRPAAFNDMVTYEREALGCSGAAAKPLASLPWLANTGSGGAKDFLVATLKMDPAAAASLISSAQTQMTASCTNLAPLATVTQNKQAMDGLIDHEFLPEELVTGKGRTYAVADLYK